MSFDNNNNMNDGSNNQSGFTGQNPTGRAGFDQGQGQDQFSSSTDRGMGGGGDMGGVGGVGGYGDAGGMRDPSRTDEFSTMGAGAGTGTGGYGSGTGTGTGTGGYGSGTGTGGYGSGAGMQAGGTDDFSSESTGAGSGVGFGSGAGMQGGGMQGFDADERERERASGHTGTGGKPSMGDKIKGGAEKLAGKITGDANKQERGQERKMGADNNNNY